MATTIGRRQFISALSGAAAWPLAARAQHADRMRRIGVLLSGTDGDSQIQAALAAFTKALQEVGWTDGRNIRIEHYWGAADENRIRAAAAEIAGKSPDVIFASGTQVTSILKEKTGTIPIVFVNVADPVSSGFVDNFAHPGRNITGFTSLEFSLAGKWLGILKDIVPNLANVMVLYVPQNSNWEGYLSTLEAAASSARVTVRAAPILAAAEIAGRIESFAREPGAAMLVLPSGPTIANRQMIAAIAVRHRLPAIYPYRNFAESGGLASYGSDTTDLYRRAAQYVDRILRGEQPGDLPIQAPTKFEFVINLKTAKALGLTIPPTVLARADEVIE